MFPLLKFEEEDNRYTPDNLPTQSKEEEIRDNCQVSILCLVITLSSTQPSNFIWYNMTRGMTRPQKNFSWIFKVTPETNMGKRYWIINEF